MVIIINFDNFFTLLKYFIVGLIQGVTEPIPISSSGHVELAQYFFNLNISGFSFALLVNTASLIAIVIVYKNDIARILTNGFLFLTTRDQTKKSEFHFIIFIIIGTIPAGVLGLLFEDLIANTLSQNIKIIGFTLFVTGLAIWGIRNLRGRKNDNNITYRDAIIVGLAQAVALVPGISRSGATIVAAMGLGMKQETALRFSFLLYIPISVGGMILSFKQILTDPNLASLAIPYAVAFITSFIATYFALRLFMRIMATGNLKYFSYYCFIAGTLIFIFA